MRLVKTFGLTALLAVAMTVFMGAATAMAKESTLLCNAQHGEKSRCPEGQATSSLSIEAKGISLLLNDLIDILCLQVSATLSAGPQGETAQTLSPTSMKVSECGMSASHNNCTVTVEENPTFLLLKTALNLGLIEGHGGRINIKCTVFSIVKIDCTYSAELGVTVPAEGALHTESAGNGKIELDEVPNELTVGGALCPTESTLDALLEPSEHIWIASSEGGSPPSHGTALCKVHSESCSEQNQVKNIHLVSSEPTVLLNSVANVECEGSLIQGEVLALGTEPTPQKVDVSKWTWSDCHTQGATENCTVSTEALPAIQAEKTSLNVGTATVQNIEVAVHCNILGLHEMDCSFGGTVELPFEGALRQEGSGHGMLTAEEAELEEVSGGKYCPDGAKWDALYEPSEHVFIVD